MKKKLSFAYKVIAIMLFVCTIWNGKVVEISAKNTTNTPSTTSTPNNKSKERVNERKKNLKKLPGKIQEVIAGKRRFIDAKDGKKYTLKSYHMLNMDDKKVKVHWGNYIVADIDSDKQNEIIIEVVDANNLNSADIQRRVFDLQGNKVYCYTYVYRAILRVYSNGAMEGSSGAADNILYKAAFNKRESIDMRIAESKSTTSGKVNYYIGKKKVSQKKYKKFLKKYQGKRQLEWSKYSLI